MWTAIYGIKDAPERRELYKKENVTGLLICEGEETIPLFFILSEYHRLRNENKGAFLDIRHWGLYLNKQVDIYVFLH